MSKVELPTKRGNFVDFRAGLVNLCLVERSCRQAEREEFVLFDQEYQAREKKEALEKEFYYNLNFAMGEQISIYVFPIGWNKTFRFEHAADVGFKEIHYFGDKTDPGGNDREIYCDKRIIG